MKDLKRNFPSGPRHFFRHFADYPLYLKIEFPEGSFPAGARLYTDLFASSENWQVIDARLMEAERAVEIRLEDLPRGRYHFRFQFQWEKDGPWVWDTADYSYLMVDNPVMRDLRIYTFIPRVLGSVDRWERRLHEVAEMGFNAVQLLPLSQMSSSLSPYAAGDLMRLDSTFVSPSNQGSWEDQLNAFVDACRSRNLKVGVDLVLNHVGMDNPLVREKPEWFVGDSNEEDGIKRAGWWRGTEWVPWRDLALLNMLHPEPKIREEMWEYMGDYAVLWAGFAHKTTGFVRLDNLHSTPTEFTAYILERLRDKYPDLFILAEFFALWEEMLDRVYQHEIDLILATEWEEKFAPDLRRLLTFYHARAKQVKIFTPISSHDSGPPTEEFMDVRTTLSRYAVAVLFGFGVTGMVMGVEYGVRRKIPFIGPVEDSFPEEVVADLRGEITAINRVMADHPEFREGGNLMFVDGEHQAILAGIRLNRQKQPRLLVLVNMDIHKPQSFHPRWPENLAPTLREKAQTVYASGSFQWTGPRETLHLEPGAVAVVAWGN